MMPGNVYGRPVTEAAADTAEPVAGPVTGVVGGDDPADVDAGRRVDLGRVLTGLRHLSAAVEPARVFTDLAAVCVPALCDECLIEIVEQGGHRYRIRRPGPGPGRAIAATDGMTNPAANDCAGMGERRWSGRGAVVTVTDGSVIARFGNPPGGGPDYTGQLVCTWRHGHVPVEADAALVGVLVDHAIALVHRERTTTPVSHPDAAGQVRLALDGTQRIAAAAGILMALYHLSPAQARRLLARAGDHTHLLTVTDRADDGFFENADRFSLFLRQRDGWVGRVTFVRREQRKLRLHGDG
jgi:hypothetical protein